MEKALAPAPDASVFRAAAAYVRPCVRVGIGPQLRGVRCIAWCTDAETPALTEQQSDVERVGAAYRAFALDADTYPAAAVALAARAARAAIADAESRISDDHLSVAEAEFYIKRVRTCEALLECDAEWREDEAAWHATWAVIAEACERALAGLPSQHPRRNEIVKLVQDARLAAQLPMQAVDGDSPDNEAGK